MLFEIVVNNPRPALRGHTVGRTEAVAPGALVPGRLVKGSEAGLGFAQADKSYLVGGVGHEWRDRRPKGAPTLVVHLLPVEAKS